MTQSPPNRIPATRDLDSLTGDGWPLREFPLAQPRDGQSVPIVIKRSVLAAVYGHGSSRTDVEICGVLVGNVYRDSQGPFVYVEFAIRGDHAGSQMAQVTFTAKTWAHIHGVMDKDYPDCRIMGWYHTHPGFGIFLSPMDIFIQENFFGAQEQLAFVYDPLGNDAGLFAWHSGSPVIHDYLIEEDQGVRGIENLSVRVRAVTAAAAAGATDTNGFGERLCRYETRQRVLTAALIVVAVFSLVWPVALGFIMWSYAPDRPHPTPSPNSGRNGGDVQRKELIQPPDLSPNQQGESLTRPLTDTIRPTEADAIDPAGSRRPGNVTGNSAIVPVGAKQPIAPAAKAPPGAASPTSSDSTSEARDKGSSNPIKMPGTPKIPIQEKHSDADRSSVGTKLQTQSGGKSESAVPRVEAPPKSEHPEGADGLGQKEKDHGQ